MADFLCHLGYLCSTKSIHLLVSKLAPFPDFDPVIVTQFSAPSDHVRINDKGLARTYYSTTVYEPILMAN